MQPQNNNTYNQPPMGQMMPPQTPMPMGRRAKWSRKLMSGASAFITSLPDWFATYAVATYAIALIGVNFIFSQYAMEWYFWLFGIVWVTGFFFMSVKFSRDWNESRIRNHKAFEKKLFITALVLRVSYAIFIHHFYLGMTGLPYEFAYADSEGYVDAGKWLADSWRDGTFQTTLKDIMEQSFSDTGYPLFLFLPMLIFEGDFAHLAIRLIHAIIGAHLVVLIYRLSSRTFEQSTARMAAIFCMLHPVLICYVGFALKETLMTWLLVMFVYQADKMMVGKKYSFATIAPVLVVGFIIFMFRTVLGMVAFMAIFFALLMMDTKFVGWGKKVVLGMVMIGTVMIGASDNIMREVDKIRNTNLQEEQSGAMANRYGSGKGGDKSGNSFANYAGAAVFAPLIFTIPFPTMVDVGFQEDMRLIHGGNWMRNVMSGFVILAMVMLLLSGDWRKYTMPLAVLLGYLVVLVFSVFAHSLRFHVPVMPFEMMFAAYAITNIRKKHKVWYLLWCLFMVVACFGWNWMKLKGRGL